MPFQPLGSRDDNKRSEIVLSWGRGRPCRMGCLPHAGKQGKNLAESPRCGSTFKRWNSPKQTDSRSGSRHRLSTGLALHKKVYAVASRRDDWHPSAPVALRRSLAHVICRMKWLRGMVFLNCTAQFGMMGTRLLRATRGAVNLCSSFLVGGTDTTRWTST